jgi:surfactin synthase thioesterase subunit
VPAARPRWIVSWAPDAPPTARLLCLAHAGAGASYFRPWTQLLPTVAIGAVRLPGRESRVSEAPVGSMEELVPRLREALEPAVAAFPDTVFVGVCSGALMLFEVVHALARAGAALPAGLVVVSQTAPDEAQRDTARVSDLPLRDVLVAVGDPDPALLEHPELAQMVEPALRADVRVVERYVFAGGPPLPVPIAAIRARDDVRIGLDQLRAWSSYTSATSEVREIEGDHLFAGSEGVRALATAVAEIAASFTRRRGSPSFALPARKRG